MEQLNELEKKILDIIQKNKELFDANSKLKIEIDQLKEQNRQFEGALLKESGSTKTLEEEKKSVKTTIEELLSTINSLDSNE